MRNVCKEKRVVIFLVFWLILFCATQVHSQEENENAENKSTPSEAELRTKRQLIPLVYPYGAIYKLLIGFTMPIHNEDNIPLIFAVNFQYQYMQIDNITSVSQYYQYLTVSRAERSKVNLERQDERLVFYTAIEGLLSSKGFNGRDCVLRAICEAAQYPVEEEGLAGELLHILLTPDYGRSAFAKQDSSQREYQEIMAEYLSAQTAGGQLFHCASVYAGCPEGEGLMEIISQLRDD